jgi:hypothetical protein
MMNFLNDAAITAVATCAAAAAALAAAVAAAPPIAITIDFSFIDFFLILI